MSKRTKENIWIIILLLLLGVYFYFNVNYYDRYLIEKPLAAETKK